MQPYKDYANGSAQVFALCTTILFLKYFVGLVLAADPSNRPPEDGFTATPNPSGDKENQIVEGTPAVTAEFKRFRQAQNNDLETIPFALIIFWATFLLNVILYWSNDGSRECIALSTLFVMYTGFRLLYSFFYWTAINTFKVRSLCFAASIFCIFGCCALLLSDAFQLNFGTVNSTFAHQ